MKTSVIPSTSSIEQEVAEFIKALVAICIKDAKVKHLALFKKHETTLFTKHAAITSAAIAKICVPHISKQTKTPEDRLKTYLVVVNVTYFILEYLTPKQNIQKDSQLLFLSFWYNLYSAYKIAVENLLSQEITHTQRNFYQESISDCFTLFDQYIPRFAVLLMELYGNNDLAESALAFNAEYDFRYFCRSLMEIDHLQSLQLYNSGKHKESLDLVTRCKKRVEFIQSKFSSIIEVKSVRDSLEELEKKIRSLQQPNVVDFFKEISKKEAQPKFVSDAALLDKYQHLFTNPIVNESIETLIKMCSNPISEAKTPDEIALQQARINVLHYLLQAIILKQPNVKTLRARLVHLIGSNLSKIVVEAQVLLIEANSMLDVGLYEKYCRDIERNYLLYHVYQKELEKLVESVLGNNPISLDQTFIFMCVSQIKVALRFAELCLYMQNKEKALAALVFAKESINFGEEFFEKLVRKRIVDPQKIKVNFAMFRQWYVNVTEKCSAPQKFMVNDLKSILWVIDQILECKPIVLSTYSASRAAVELNEIALNISPLLIDEDLDQLQQLTFRNLPPLTSLYDVSQDAVKLYNTAALLCLKWIEINKTRFTENTKSGLQRFYYCLMLEKLEHLARNYLEKAAEIEKLSFALPLNELLVRVRSLPLNVEPKAYIEVYAEFQSRHFQDKVCTQKTIDNIVLLMDSSLPGWTQARLNIMHFLQQVLSEELRRENPHILCILWGDLVECCNVDLGNWMQNNFYIGDCHDLFYSIKSLMTLYFKYKAEYQVLLDMLTSRKDVFPKVKSRLKGKVFDHYLSFVQIEGAYLNFLLMIGVDNPTVDKLRKTIEFRDHLARRTQDISIIDGPVTAQQKSLFDSVKSNLTNMEKDIRSPSPLMMTQKMMYHVLAEYETELIEILELLIISPQAQSLNMLTDVNPLMILEALTESANVFDLKKFKRSIDALKELKKEKYRFILREVISTFIDLCTRWSVGLQNGKESIVLKMIIEKLNKYSYICLQYLPHTSASFVVAPMRLAQCETLVKMLKDIDSMEAGHEQKYKTILHDNTELLFNNGVSIYINITHIISVLESSTDFNQNINTAHFLLFYALPIFTKKYGQMFAFENKLLVIMWNSLLEASEKVIKPIEDKSIAKGSYQQEFNIAEVHIKMFELYLPKIKKYLDKNDRILSILNNVEKAELWRLHVSIISAHLIYANLRVLKWDLMSAEKSLNAAKKYLDFLKGYSDKEHAQETLQQLFKTHGVLSEYLSSSLKPPITYVRDIGQVLAMLYKFEKEARSVLSALKEPYTLSQGEVQPLVFSKSCGVVELINVFPTMLEKSQRTHAKENLETIIKLFKACRDNIDVITHDKIREFCVVELVTEKLDEIISQCEKTLPDIPLSPLTLMEQLADKLEETTLMESSAAVVRMHPEESTPAQKSVPVPVVVPLQTRPVRVEAKTKQVPVVVAIQTRPVSADTEQSRLKANALLRAAEMIPALQEDYSGFYPEYRDLYIIKAALNRLKENNADKTITALINRINLAYFMLVFAVSYNQDVRPKVREALLVYLRNDLECIIKTVRLECINNKVPLGECSSNIQLLMLCRDLYSRVANNQSDVKFEMNVDDWIREITELQDPILEKLKKFEISQLKSKQSEIDAKLPEMEKRPLNEKTLDEVYEYYSKVAQSLLCNKTVVFLSGFSSLCRHWIASYRKAKHTFIQKLIIEKLRVIAQECDDMVSEIRNMEADLSVKSEVPVEPNMLVESETQVADEIEVVSEMNEVVQALEDLKLQQNQEVSVIEEQLPKSTVVRMQETVSKVQPFKPGTRSPSPVEENGGVNQSQRMKCISDNFRLPPDIALLLRRLQMIDKNACLVGGAIRDWLLGLPCNDYDFFLSCDREEFINAFPKEYIDVIPAKRSDLFQLKTVVRKHDIVLNSKREPDFTINAFRFDGKNITNPYGTVEDIMRSPYLEIIGDCRKRFQDDPILVLRTIRMMVHTGKTLTDDNMRILKEFAPCVTKAEIGLFLNNISALFLRDRAQAYRAIDLMIEHDILNCLLPGALTFEGDRQFLFEQIDKLYDSPVVPRIDAQKYLKHSLLSVFLMQYIQKVDPKMEHPEIINNVVDIFCNSFGGFEVPATEIVKEKKKTHRMLCEILGDLYPKPDMTTLPQFNHQKQFQAPQQPEQDVVHQVNTSILKLKSNGDKTGGKIRK